MKWSIRSIRRAGGPARRAALAIVATAALALAAVGFGSAGPAHASDGASHSRPSTLSRAANVGKALAFSRCMRAHGVTRFPDPTSTGVIPKTSVQELGVSSSQFDAAEKACQRLLPAGSNDQYPPGEVPLILRGMLRFSRCMRSHGVPEWPDPTTDAEGRPIFPLPAAGISRQESRSARTMRAARECHRLLPSVMPGIPIG
jgi:hypothetical protein